MINQDSNSHPFNTFLDVAEHWASFLTDGSKDFSWGPFFDLIGVETFPDGQGAFQQTGIWRPAKTAVTGLAGWRDIVTSRAPGTNGAGDAGVNACGYSDSIKVGLGNFEIWKNWGKQLELESDPVCSRDLRYIKDVKQQLGYMVKQMLKYTKEYTIAWNREQYMISVMASKHSFVMTPGGVGYGAGSGAIEGGIRFYYNPYDADANGDTFLYYPAGTDVSTLDWSYLEYQKDLLSVECPDAMLKGEGDSTFMWLGSKRDFMRMIDANPTLREDMRYAMPQMLVEDYKKFGMYRGYSVAEDLGQMRFEPQGVVALAGTETDGAGGLIPAGNYVKAKRLNPEREGRSILNGAFVTEANPDFIKAPLRIGIIFMKKVFHNMCPDVIGDLGSGIKFGDAPSYRGDFRFLNIIDKDTNKLGEIGNFYARFEFHVQPEEYYLNTVAFLYRGCHVERLVLCETDGTTTSAVNLLHAIVEATDTDDTNLTVTVTLVSKLAGGDGSEVEVTNAAAATAVAYILDASQAPTYVLGAKDSTEYAKIDGAAELTAAATVQIK